MGTSAWTLPSWSGESLHQSAASCRMAAPADEEPEPGVLSSEQVETAMNILLREHHCRYLLVSKLFAYSSLPLSCSIATRRRCSLEIVLLYSELAEIVGELRLLRFHIWIPSTNRWMPW